MILYGIFFNRKLKPSQYTEKETTKASQIVSKNTINAPSFSQVRRVIYIVFLCYLGGIYTVLRKAKVLYHKLFTFLVCASLIRKLLYFYNPSQSFSVYTVTSVK